MINAKKLLAVMLVFTMTFSYFSVVTEAIATTSFISLFENNSGTGNENVEFEAYLADGNDASNVIVSDVNNENLNIKLQLDVINGGYLKDGKVEIKAEDEKTLNFAIKEDNEVAEFYSDVQSLEENILDLNKIDYSSEKIEINIPIEYKNEEYINEEKLSNTAKVILSGIYVDDEGEENEISKEVELTLAWKDERTIMVQDEFTKYIQFGEDGIILQQEITVDNTNEDKNTLPVKETMVNIDVPTIQNVKPSEVLVIASSTNATNGKGVGETEFDSSNWNYDSDENKLNIKVENNKQLVNVSSQDNFLKEENEEVIEEERYYSNAGADKYIVTYTYRNVGHEDEVSVSSKVEAEEKIFSGVQSENNETNTKAENEQNVVLEGQTGNIVSYNIENGTENKSKAYGYLNKETEYNSKTEINVSYKEIVQEIIVEDTENYYIDKSDNKIQTDDIYYKEISVSKDNFNEILGEDGKIDITDIDGNVLVTINNEMTVDENGNYVVSFQNKISKLAIKTSAPIAEGNLIISNKKAVSNVNVSKEDYENVKFLATTTVQKAKFDYVSDLVELGNNEIKTELIDTVTDINLVVDRESFSTVTTNSNVEIRLELNNDKETSDIYGDSIFEVEMPKYITSMELTNASMIYGEGLDIANVETFVNENGRVMIRVIVSGKQTDFNSGVLTNGTNIVLNANVTIDKYTPSIETSIKAFVNNSEATNYSADYKEVKIDYSAPNGLVAINTITNYNELGATLTSVKEGEKVDYIDIYSEARTATMEIVVVNNNNNSVTDLAILGRIPFKGVKDIASNNDIGTTVDTKIVSEIISNESNKGEFTVYYSTNEEATKDLSDSSNNWVKNPESFEDIKSYLIVPNDGEYELEAKQTLKFTYDYEIPENLNHNENIYGTFLAYYTNQSEVAVTDETSKPDLVGLTTGQGPELELKMTSNVENVKANDEITLTTTIKNSGEDLVRDVNLLIPIPEHTIFVSAETDRDTVTAEYVDGNVIVRMDTLSVETEVNITTVLKVEKIYEDSTASIFATVTAKDLGTEIKSKEVTITFESAEIDIEQFVDDISEDFDTYYYEKGEEVRIGLVVQNLTEKTQKNVEIVSKLPKELEFSKGFADVGNEEESIMKYSTYNSNDNTVVWNIDEIEANTSKELFLDAIVGDLEPGVTQDIVKISTKASADNTETYNAEDVDVKIGKTSLSITQTTSTETYVTEGKEINYIFEVKNEGASLATNVILKDKVPEGVVFKKISYELKNGELVENKMSQTEEATLNFGVSGNSTLTINVTALALNLDGAMEKTVTNVATISNDSTEEITSNSVTHIIKAAEKPNDESAGENESPTNNSNPSYDNNTSTDITKSYKITGTAWLDSNENGMRDDNENRMGNITAMLVDSNSGIIKATTTTNENGEYVFAGLQNGSYLVIFKYDTTLYTTTTYKKEGIESNINSDAVTTKIEQDGRKENAAITDVISVNGANVSNIDLGLVESAQFSLQLDKTITKVTVQNSQGTVTEEFDNTKLAKYDIAAKYLSGTTVYVEYQFTVKNNGDLAGYATEIVDYLPKGMTFNSNLNPDWYTGTDGNLYTKALADIELVQGESRTIKLVLIKQMTAENTGLVSNTAEISEDYNIYGVSDKNSKPLNKAQGEDDISTADTILTVKTGESLIYLSGIIIGLIAGCAVAFIVYERVLKNKRKGGV